MPPSAGTQATTVVPLPGCSRCRAYRSPAAPVRACSPGRGASPAEIVRVEAGAVVRDGEEQSAVRSAQPDARAAAPGRGGPRCSAPPAPHGTGRAPGPWRDHRAAARGPRRARAGLCALRRFALRPQRLGQAQLLQDRRVQLVGERVDVLAEAHESLADCLHRLRMRLVRGGASRRGRRRWPGRPAAESRRRAVRARAGRAPPRAPRSGAGSERAAPPRSLALGDVAQHAERLDACGRRGHRAAATRRCAGSISAPGAGC